MAGKRIHGGYLGRKQYEKQLKEAEATAKKPASADEGSTSTGPSQNYWDKVSEAFSNINVPESVKKIFGR